MTNIKQKAREMFDELYKHLGFKDELSFEEIPADEQVKQLIDQIIDMAIAEERERMLTILNTWKTDTDIASKEVDNIYEFFKNINANQDNIGNAVRYGKIIGV